MLTPGFPISDDTPYAPAIVDTLCEISKKHDVEVHAISPPPFEHGEHTFRGLKISTYGARTRVARAFELSRALGRRWDLVWSFWLDRTGLAGLTIASLLRVPLIVSVMGGELSSLPDAGYRWIDSRRGSALAQAIARRAASITVGSQPLAATAEELLPKARTKVRIAPVGSLISRIAERDREPWRPGHPLSIIAVSGPAPVKRVDLLLETMCTLAQRGIDASLDLYGDAGGVLRERFLARADALGVGGRVRHHGFVSAGELGRTLARYDVLMHASAFESQGVALIEAGLAGLPIATTSVGVAAELKALGAAIEVVDSAPELLSGALAGAVISAAACKAARAVRPVIEARFGVDACAHRFSRIIEEAAAC